MRISRIILNNYRQFEKLEIALDRSHDHDLHLFIGTNGTGKTNILNAINWCLYNDEPHLSKMSEGLPIPNINELEKIELGDDIIVSVELWLECDHEEPITISRKCRYKKIGNNNVSKQHIDFEVSYIDEENNRKFAIEDEAISWVERIFPNSIREYFFFDGERLDHYFRDATGQRISNAIFKISQIDLLQELERKIQIIKNDITAEASRANPNIDLKSKELLEIDASLKSYGDRIEICNQQILIATHQIEEYNEKLMGVPDLEKLEIERHNLKCTLEEKIMSSKNKEIQRNILLYDYGRNMMLKPAIDKALQIVINKKKNKEIPPTIDKGLIENIIRNNVCSICNQPLNDNAKNFVTSLYSNLRLSIEEASQLEQINSYLGQIKDSYKDVSKRIIDLGKEINKLEEEISQINIRLKEIANAVEGYDEEDIIETYKDRDKYEQARTIDHERLGMFRLQREILSKQKIIKEKELDQELAKGKKFVGIKNKITFCSKTLEVVRKSMNGVMEETREKIECTTANHFFNLIWKKDTFRKVVIEEDYTVKLIHSLGYSCLGTVSAGERCLLALAFTLALHDSSGFEAPIMIDTPVSRISDKQREKFAEVLGDVGTHKQVLLLFTPSEYSPEVSKVLDNLASTKYEITLIGEKTTRMEKLQ
ncbi:MAG: hypothetical protein A2029_02740 [Chloroflexi bacterium RBG_19FT_COMBO_47_9]|nr:MAG: hypothetical protein A2029_02740 [Chloroflexi bacterium RBG_19FT_COMBO_47_9]